MEYIQLGTTELKVSVAGLGCGGNSRLGQSTGSTTAESVSIIHHALDLGVNFFDTAPVYGTEKIVGSALRNTPRDSVVLSTKCRIQKDKKLLSAAQIIASLEQSLLGLQTDYIDVFHLHAVQHKDYGYVCSELVPALLRECEKGKFSHLGITETPPNDPRHTMLACALDDEFWEVIMIGFHMMHQNAREFIFPRSRERRIGTLIMFAVRSIFSDLAYLSSTVTELVQSGKLAEKYGHSANPLNFLLQDGEAASIVDAAYRYARHEPGADVILFGTGNSVHLEQNVRSILAPPLSRAVLERIEVDFAHLEGVGLDLPRNR